MSKSVFCRVINVFTVSVLFSVVMVLQPLQGFALNANNIIAYPVPFNPNIQVMNINFSPGNSEIVNRVKVEIFDINGDLVLEREYSSLPVVWNGRNGSGRMVGAGMYIIKVTVEETSTGAHGMKIIRILVNR